MKKARKKLISMLLTVCMVLTMLPTVVLAEEANSGATPSTSKITSL